MAKRVIPRRDEVEVYIAENGFISIAQTDPQTSNSQVISLPHEDISKLIDHLYSVVKEREELEDDDFTDGDNEAK